MHWFSLFLFAIVGVSIAYLMEGLSQDKMILGGVIGIISYAALFVIYSVWVMHQASKISKSAKNWNKFR